MVLHPGAEVVRGRNLLWCATTQLAWDALGQEMQRMGGRGPDLRLGAPARPDLVAAMNRHEFPHGDLDPESYVVESGLVGGGLVPRFLDRVRALVPEFPLDLSGLDPEGVAALAYLRKDLPFAQPFLVHERPMAFDEGKLRTAAFGVEPEGIGAAQTKMLGQLRLHEVRPGSTFDDASPEFALTLAPRETGDRIVLGRIPPPASLDAGWRTVAAMLARDETRLDARTELWIPKVDFATTHRFRELEGSPLLDAPPMQPPTELEDVRQRLEFTLSEEGARLVAAVAMASNQCVGAPSPRPRLRSLRFDRPFLLALVRDGATKPYFLSWFGNDELFVRR